MVTGFWELLQATLGAFQVQAVIRLSIGCSSLQDSYRPFHFRAGSQIEEAHVTSHVSLEWRPGSKLRYWSTRIMVCNDEKASEMAIK
jgi:hypothetical protein